MLDVITGKVWRRTWLIGVSACVDSVNGDSDGTPRFLYD